MSETGRSSDSGLPPPPPSRHVPVASWRESILPLQRRDRPGLSPGSLTVLRFGADPTMPSCAGTLASSPGLPVLVWCGVIFWFSSVPHLSTGLGTWDLVLRKRAHLAEYAILMMLLLRARIPVWLAFLLGVLYASSDEWHQTFVGGTRGSAARRPHRFGRAADRPLGVSHGLPATSRELTMTGYDASRPPRVVRSQGWNVMRCPTGSSTRCSSDSTGSRPSSSGSTGLPSRPTGLRSSHASFGA